MTNNQKKIMYLPKKLQSKFEDELPQTDDIDVLWEFKQTYNTRKAEELRKELRS